MDFPTAREAPGSLCSLDSPCAESGLEEVIGDLLAQEQAAMEDEERVGRGEEDEGLRGLELTLRCAVGEIHSDLQAFGKKMDARLEAATCQVAPLAQTVALLQEENLRLRIQQERLARQVEALCKALGLPEPELGAPVPRLDPTRPTCPDASAPPDNTTFPPDSEVPSNGTHEVGDSESPSNQYPAATQSPESLAHEEREVDQPNLTSQLNGTQAELPRNGTHSAELPGSPSNGEWEGECASNGHTRSGGPSEVACVPVVPETAPGAVSAPHPPTFAAHRSFSAPSLLGNVCRGNSMVRPRFYA